MEDPFVCPRCGHQFTQRGNLARHLKRKTPCRAAPPDKPDRWHCDDCGRGFSRKWYRDEHRSTPRCPNWRRSEDAQRIAALEEELAALRVGGSSVTHNTTNNTQINIMVQAPARVARRDFGAEDLSYITPDWLMATLASIPEGVYDATAAGKFMVRRTMDAIWANAEHPENFTVTITTPRGDPLILEDGRWRKAPMGEIQEHMQNQAANAVLKLPAVTLGDYKLRSAVSDGMFQGEYLTAARSTMDNAKADILAFSGKLPLPGETVPRDPDEEKPRLIPPPDAPPVDLTKMSPVQRILYDEAQRSAR